MSQNPQPRRNVGQIPTYVPGKPPTPRPGLTTYKLSSNENPYPPLPGVVEAATRAAEAMNRYPDMGNSALYDALSARLGVPTSDLAAATGSVALIYQLLNAFCDPGDEVVYAWRSFEAYPIAATVADATSVRVPVLADGRHDLDAMAAAVSERTKVVIVCTPNNPTGPSVTQSALLDFLAKVPSHVLVVVDEAYVEFVRMDHAVDGLAVHRDFANVAVTRTPSPANGRTVTPTSAQAAAKSRLRSASGNQTKLPCVSGISQPVSSSAARTRVRSATSASTRSSSSASAARDATAAA